MRRQRSTMAGIACLALAATVDLPAATREIRIVGGARPAVLERIETDVDALAVAFDPAGARAAVAISASTKEPRSIVRLYASDRASAIEVSIAGVVRALVWPADTGGLFAIVHRPARRGPGEAHLVLVDPEAPRPRELRLLPSSASGLDVWSAARSLVIAAEDEIRSFHLDGLRSGPLYRIPGRNLAVASLAGSNLMLIGQASEILLVDLGDPPGLEQMPVRERTAVPAPVRAIAVSADATDALAAFEDGRTWSLAFGPLRLARDLDSDAIVVGVGRGSAQAPVPVAPLVLPAPPPIAAPDAANTVIAETPPSAPEIAQPPPHESQPTAIAPSATPQATPPPEIRTRPPAPSVVEPPIVRTSLLSGLVSGPAHGEVAWVVVLGPSSLLREAARVPVDPSGIWHVERLEPGRYRVQLDGGSAGTIVSDPPFVMVEVGEERVACREIRALRLVRP